MHIKKGKNATFEKGHRKEESMRLRKEVGGLALELGLVSVRSRIFAYLRQDMRENCV
jgi:hypothetical protein